MATNHNNSDAHAWWNELERLERIMNRVGPDEVCCEGLTPRQTNILRILASSEGARLSELAAQAGVTPGAMTRLLDRLESQDLVQRVRGTQEDGRAATVRITARGLEVRESIDRLMIERANQVIQAVPERKRTRVLEALRTLNEALESACCCDVGEPLVQIGKVANKENGR